MSKQMRESKVYGVNASLQFTKHREKSVLRAFFSQKTAPLFGTLQKSLAKSKRPYRILTDDELQKVGQTQHHEGVVLIVEMDAPKKAEDWLRQRKPAKDCIVLLENIGNPHNLGAIIRNCAHFAVSAICHPDAKALQSGAALRTAEGGAEHLEILEYKNLKDLALAAKKAGYTVLSTSSHKGQDIYKTKLPEKMILFFGEEGDGLSESAFKISDASVKIPGTGKVESLNVATAVALIVGEHYRQNQT